jgi:hypothetical protein
MNEFKSFVESTKMFGKDAKRVSNEETQAVFKELQAALGSHFTGMELVKALPSKLDHGDIDIVAHGNNPDVEGIVRSALGDKVLKFYQTPKSPTNCFLYNSSVGQVHVDIIMSSDETGMRNKGDYYAYGDFSAIISLIAKELGFKYGSEGFFKRFQDNKGSWHDIPLPIPLLGGLKILGFDESKYSSIHNIDDVINFIASSPLVDSAYFTTERIVSRDRLSLNRRTNLNFIFKSLRVKNLRRKFEDEDIFFKKYFPSIYEIVERQKEQIDSKIYGTRRPYNGNWIMSTFKLQPGPEVKQIAQAMNQHFGTMLSTIPESEVINFVKGILDGRDRT